MNDNRSASPKKPSTLANSSNANKTNSSDPDVLVVGNHQIPRYENSAHNPDDLPPSYAEAVKQPQQYPSNHQHPRPSTNNNHRIYVTQTPASSGSSSNTFSPQSRISSQLPSPNGSHNGKFGNTYPGSFPTSNNNQYQYISSGFSPRHSTNSITPKTPWVYPPGFKCWKCQNTGIKLKNGLQCLDCWRQFAPGSGHVRKITSTLIDNRTGRPLVLAPGDPRLGGIVCGSCRGTGMIDSFLYYDTCYVCGGLGRVEYL